MRTINMILIFVVGCLVFTNFADAQTQTTVGRLMDLEAKVAEKKMLDELEKNNSTSPLVPGGVPPIALISGASKGSVPLISMDSTKPKTLNRPPYTISILGVDQDLKADVIVNERQYQAIKGGMVGEYLVKSISASGVWLETQVATKRKGKTTYSTKVVFAALSNS